MVVQYKANEPSPRHSVEWWAWEKGLDALFADAHAAGALYTDIGDIFEIGASSVARRAKREMAHRACVCVTCGQALPPKHVRRYDPEPEPARSPDSNPADGELSLRAFRLVEITGEPTWKSLSENWTRRRLAGVKGFGPSTAREIAEVARAYGVEIKFSDDD